MLLFDFANLNGGSLPTLHTLVTEGYLRLSYQTHQPPAQWSIDRDGNLGLLNSPPNIQHLCRQR